MNLNRCFMIDPRALLTCALFTALFGLSACGGMNPLSSSSEKSGTRNTVGSGAQPANIAGRQATVLDPDAKRTTRVISQTEFGYVRLEAIEDGAKLNNHPHKIDAAELRLMLAALKVKVGGKEEQIFNQEDLDEVSEPVAIALSKAQPREDITLAVSSQHGSKVTWLTPRTVTTARLFVKDGTINVIFNEIRGNFETQAVMSGWLRPFSPGSRTRAATVSVVAASDNSYADTKRRDWVLLARPAAPSIPASAASSNSTSSAVRAPTTNEKLSPAPSAEDAQYQTIEKRLTLLKNLKEKGLIGEQEYIEKQREILKGL